MSELQKLLQEKYRKLFAIERILVENNNYIFDNDVFNERPYINNNCYCKNLIVNNDVKILFNVHCNNISSNNIFINDSINTNNINTYNLNIGNNCTICNNFNLLNTYYSINNTCNNIINNNLQCENITLTNILSLTENNINNVLTIKSNEIIINATNIIFNGTITNILNEQLNIKDKNIISNISNSSDIYHSLNILGISGNGFIRINDNIQRYQIKAPMSKDINYIFEINKDENIFISGTSNINNLTILSNININNNSIINGQLFGTNFNNKTDLTIINNCYSNNIYVNNNCIIFGDLYSINISTNNIICNSISVNNSLVVSKEVCLLNLTSSNLTCNNIISNNFTVNSIIYTNDCNIINNLSLGNTLNVNNKSNIDNNFSSNNLNIKQDLYIENKVYIPTNTTIVGNINISSNAMINNININNLITLELPSYDNNYHAALNGVNIWELYRTGGIVKIRLDIIPPIIILQGNASITHDRINFNKYTEPGVSSFDEEDGVLPVYISSIKNSLGVNFLATPVLYQNQLTINVTTNLTDGIYTINYESTDIIGNIGKNTRILNV